MNKCYHCGKHTVFGRTHTHHRGVAGGRWKKRAPKVNRKFRANLHAVLIIESGKRVRVKLCAKCLKRIDKDLRDKKTPLLNLVHQKSRFLGKLKEIAVNQE